MTYREAVDMIKNPYELNKRDEKIEGFDTAQMGDNTFGYKIYILDKEGKRHSHIRAHSRKPEEVEHNVYYWHNKDIAKAYMVYLANALPQYTYGLYEVEAVKGDRLNIELLYNEHTAHYGQVASELRVTNDAPIQILTPEMLEVARKEPDRELFS